MAGRFARSLDLAKASWTVVKADKELLLLPVMSVASLILIVGSLAVPVAVLGGFTTGAAGDDPSTGTMLGALLFYIVAYFITLFFNTALVGAAMMRMDGHDPRLSDGLRIAWERAGRIFLYACIAATVGMILRAIEERVGWLGQIVVKLIGVGWALATFLVVPVLVTRDVGPIEAVKDSASLLRRTWGENIIGNVGLGLVFGVVYLVLIAAFVVVLVLAAQANVPALAAIVVLVFGLAYFGLAIVAALVVMAAIQSGSTALIALVIALGLLAFFTLSALHATMQGVYSAALYRYATDHATPLPGFDANLLESAFAPKK